MLSEIYVTVFHILLCVRRLRGTEDVVVIGGFLTTLQLRFLRILFLLVYTASRATSLSSRRSFCCQWASKFVTQWNVHVTKCLCQSKLKAIKPLIFFIVLKGGRLNTLLQIMSVCLSVCVYVCVCVCVYVCVCMCVQCNMIIVLSLCLLQPKMVI